MRARSWLKLLPGLLLVLALTGTALAGGVVVTVDEALGSVTPNTPFDVNFTIRSAHDQSLQDDFTPIITATNADTGATLKFEATAGADPGRYQTTLTLPAGTWNWTIRPDAYYPENLTAVMTPIEVKAAVAAPASAAARQPISGLWLPLVGLAALAALALVWGRRPRRISVTA